MSPSDDQQVGRVAVVTGANVGIGKETAVGLARLGMTTVLACRNLEKAAAAAQEVKERSGHDEVHVVGLDLADLASVQAAVTAIEERWNRLDVLVNNAGGIWTKRHTTTQGFERTFGVNHLGPFYLTNLLLGRLCASAPARVVNLASSAHGLAFRGMRWHDLQTKRHYTAMGAYSRSKLANVLFTRGLARRFDPAALTANAAHPGIVRSGFGMDGDMTGLFGLGYRLLRPFEISPEAGATTSIFLATEPSIGGITGVYWANSSPAGMSAPANSDESADRLWTESERLLAEAGFAVVPRLPIPQP